MDHCPACQVVRELTDHRDNFAAGWSPRRVAFNYAILVAQAACPGEREISA